MSQCPIFVSYDPGPGRPGGDSGPGEVAIVPGLPAGACTQTDGANSLPIGATLGSVNKNGAVQARSVRDVNQVNALAIQQVVNGQTVVNDYQSVGWLYLDDQGGVWFQFDPLTAYSVSVTWNVNQYFGLTLNIPNPQNPVYVANPPKVAAANNHLQTVTCWSKGRSLVPGTLSAGSANA